MGILYLLNAGEYPEQYDYPKDSPSFQQRGVVHISPTWSVN
ncbi:hypothetical protein [Novosphingobium sp. BW1]|nr:hypothetical protein [Novosphingobium sp. BW1]